MKKRLNERTLKRLIQKLLLEADAYSGDLSQLRKMTANNLGDYSDILNAADYANIYKVLDGPDTALASAIASGERIGDFGETQLRAIAKAGNMGIAPQGEYNTAATIDTNEWVNKQIMFDDPAMSPAAFGGFSAFYLGGTADSVGVDAWIPTNEEWAAVKTLSSTLDLTKCGLALSMKMSTATDSSGKQTIQNTKFSKKSGVEAIGYLLTFAFMAYWNDNNPNNNFTLDADLLGSSNDYGEAIAAALLAKGITEVKFKGGAYNGSIAQSTALSSELTVSAGNKYEFIYSPGVEFKKNATSDKFVLKPDADVTDPPDAKAYFDGIKSPGEISPGQLKRLKAKMGGHPWVEVRETIPLADVTLQPTYGNLASIINVLLNINPVALQDFLAAEDAAEAFNAVKSALPSGRGGGTGAQFAAPIKSNYGDSSITLGPRAINVGRATDLNIYNLFMALTADGGPIEKMLEESFGLDPTMALSFISTEAHDYVLDVESTGFTYKSGQIFGTKEENFPKKDELIIIGKYGMKSYLRAFGTSSITKLPTAAVQAMDQAAEEEVSIDVGQEQSVLSRVRADQGLPPGGTAIAAQLAMLKWNVEVIAALSSATATNLQLYEESSKTGPGAMEISKAFYTPQNLSVLTAQRIGVLNACAGFLDTVLAYMQDPNSLSGTAMSDAVIGVVNGQIENSITLFEQHKENADPTLVSVYDSIINKLRAIQSQVTTNMKYLKENTIGAPGRPEDLIAAADNFEFVDQCLKDMKAVFELVSVIYENLLSTIQDRSVVDTMLSGVRQAASSVSVVLNDFIENANAVMSQSRQPRQPTVHPGVIMQQQQGMMSPNVSGLGLELPESLNITTSDLRKLVVELLCRKYKIN